MCGILITTTHFQDQKRKQISASKKHLENALFISKAFRKCFTPFNILHLGWFLWTCNSSPTVWHSYAQSLRSWWWFPHQESHKHRKPRAPKQRCHLRGIVACSSPYMSLCRVHYSLWATNPVWRPKSSNLWMLTWSFWCQYLCWKVYGAVSSSQKNNGIAREGRRPGGVKRSRLSANFVSAFVECYY